MKRLILLAFLFTTYHLHAELHALPSWFTNAFKQMRLDQKYDLKTYFKPSFLEADFNGDGIKDIAVIIIEKKTGKRGIMVVHGKINKVVVFGAGTKVGEPASDNLNWIDGWELYHDKFAYETKFNNGDIVGTIKRRLSNKAISIWANEDGEALAGALITWDGNKYIWIHQGE